MRDPIYLDYNATTPPAPEVVETMHSALRDLWGNPSSSHPQGRRARAAVDRAREQTAGLLGADVDELIFTGGGTESDNAAIVGVAEACADRGRHLVISAIEHPAVDRPCDYLERRGWEVTRVGVGTDGRVEAEVVEAAFRADTVLVSIMHSNNETGVVQPVERIARSARARGIVVHTDAAQSVGKLALQVDELGVDLLTIAGHKLYAPTGVGALYLRRGTPFVPFLHGGGHESGRRAGTESVAALVGFGTACELASRELPGRTEHLRELRDRLEAGLRREIPDLIVHGDGVARLPNTLSAAIPGTDALRVLDAADGVSAAAGAACHAGRQHVSGVLSTMGLPDALALATLRLTVGRPTTTAEVDEGVRIIGAAAHQVRESGEG